MNRSITTLGLAACIIVLGACTSAREVQYIPGGAASGRRPKLHRKPCSTWASWCLTTGLPEGASDQELNERFIFPEIRRAEARYMPYHLKSTLETTGYWGAVSVLPGIQPGRGCGHFGQDRPVGRIQRATACRRLGFFRSGSGSKRPYEMLVAEQAYIRNTGPGQDPYQNIYNQIANDLLQARAATEPPAICSACARSAICATGIEPGAAGLRAATWKRPRNGRVRGQAPAGCGRAHGQPHARGARTGIRADRRRQ